MHSSDDPPHEGAPPDGASARYSELLPLIYEELRRLATHYIRGERNKTLRPTELVHEAYLKLATGKPRLVADRTHVIALMATAMRQVLVDRARARAAQKRGGAPLRVTLTDALPARAPHEDTLALDLALQHLREHDARSAHAFVLNQYGGLTQVEIAALLGVAERTIRDDLVHARTWLHRYLTQAQNGAGEG